MSVRRGKERKSEKRGKEIKENQSVKIGIKCEEVREEENKVGRERERLNE